MSIEETNLTTPTTSKQITPKKPRQKLVSIKQVEKDFKQLSKWTTHILDEETNTVIKYKAQFDEQIIDQLLEEANESIIYVQKHQLPFFTGDEQFIKYVYFLMIKYFTHLGEDIPSDFESQVPIMNQIISTGLFSDIFENVFDGNEVLKILERLDQFMVLVSKINNLEETTRNEILSSVQNKEILGNYNPHANVIHPLVNPPVSPTVADIDDIDG